MKLLGGNLALRLLYFCHLTFPNVTVVPFFYKWFCNVLNRLSGDIEAADLNISTVKYLESTRPQMSFLCRIRRAVITVAYRLSFLPLGNFIYLLSVCLINVKPFLKGAEPFMFLKDSQSMRHDMRVI